MLLVHDKIPPLNVSMFSKYTIEVIVFRTFFPLLFYYFITLWNAVSLENRRMRIVATKPVFAPYNNPFNHISVNSWRKDQVHSLFPIMKNLSCVFHYSLLGRVRLNV